MSVADRSAMINKFLWGQLSGREVADFLASLNRNVSLRREFEKELAFEGLFYSMSWNSATAPGFETDSDWAALEALIPQYGKECFMDLADTAEWNREINGAFDTAFPLTVKKREPSRIIPFPAVIRYLAAACVIGAIVGIAILVQSQKDAGKPAVAMVTATDTTGWKKIDTVHKVTEVTSIAFDSIVIFSTRSLAGKPIATETRDGIVRIGDETAILLDKSSSVAVTSQSDSAVSISLTRGSALFTVEKHRFQQFSVTTPAGDVRVTGTVFRLAIENDMTIVSVLEGSVMAKGRHDTSSIAINAGMSARIRADTVWLENGDTAATLLYRSGILRDFLHENGVFENGMFVRSGIARKSDTIAVRNDGFERRISDEKQP